jgi:hypothetical protein
MTESNVDRLREAVARVEELLKALEAPASGVANRMDAQFEAAELRVSAAADVERILTEARQVAGELRAADRRTAEAMVTEAEQVAEELDSEKRRAAAVLSEARQVAEQSHREQAPRSPETQ